MLLAHTESNNINNECVLVEENERNVFSKISRSEYIQVKGELNG